LSPLSTLAFCLVLCWMQATPSPRALPPGEEGDPARPVVEGQVKIIGEHPSVSLRDGDSDSTFYMIKANDWLRLRAGGPVNLALKLRPVAGAAKVTLHLRFGSRGSRIQDFSLAARQSVVVYFRIPAGSHEVSVSAAQKLLVRPVKLKRDPAPEDWQVEWASGKVHPPAQPALGTSLGRPAGPGLPAAAQPDLPIPSPAAPLPPAVPLPADPAARSPANPVTPEPPAEPLQVPALTPPKDPTIPSGPDGIQKP
jgi:hypothetical protein